MCVSLGLGAGLPQLSSICSGFTATAAFTGSKVILSKMGIYEFSQIESFVYANIPALSPLEFIFLYVDLREDWCLGEVGLEGFVYSPFSFLKFSPKYCG